MPFSVPMLRLDDAPGQWAFDRSHALVGQAPDGAVSLIAVVISASGPHDALDHATLARNVEAQLRRLAPDLPAVVFSRVIAERRATYACTPGLARPAGGRLARGVYLAGDYTDPEFPATLEAATRSGVAARPCAHRRFRSRRCCSRFHSRSLIVARLSYCFLPLASPRSSLIRPLL